MSTYVVIPAKGKIIVESDSALTKGNLKHLMEPTRIRVGFGSTPNQFTVGRVHAWNMVHALARVDTVIVRWEVYPGTGTCTSRCWDAKRFWCSCSCSGKKHASHLNWRELGHNWLEATLALPAELEAA